MATPRVGWHGDPALLLPHQIITLSQKEQNEYLKCMKDPNYFIKTYVQIVTSKGLSPFTEYPYQEEMVTEFQKHRFTICKIPRQYGKSTIMVAYILHQILFNENFVVAIICDKKDLAKELLSRLKLGYQHLPNFLKQAIIGWNKGDIEFANGSKVKTFAASARGVAGQSINLLYLDEFAHVPDNQAEAFYAGAYPVITSFPKSKIIITSTPNGLNMFYDFWDKAQRKVNDYFPIEVHWSAIPGRDQKWKEETIARTSEEQFRVEFECEFLGSSNTLISGSKLAALKRMILTPVIRENFFEAYEPPQKDHTYLISVDVSEGQNKDYSAFSVIDVTQIPYKQVAKYKNNGIPVVLFPSVIYNVARRYNEAFVLVEINSIGLQVASALNDELEYTNLLKIATKSPFGVGQHLTTSYAKGTHLGIRTTAPVKRIGCVNLKTLIESDKLLVNDADTIKELQSFAVSKQSFAAEGKNHDDLAMTLVLFGWLTTQPHFKELVDSNLRQTIQDENLNLYADRPRMIVDRGQPDKDPYSVNWKQDYDWEALERASEVDQDGDRWFSVFPL